MSLLDSSLCPERQRQTKAFKACSTHVLNTQLLMLNLMLAYAYCLDAMLMMTITSDKYVWYSSIIYHSLPTYITMGGLHRREACNPIWGYIKGLSPLTFSLTAGHTSGPTFHV